MEFTERVLFLQLGKFRESDLWVRFLSPSRGLLTAFAFGGSRSRRRFAGCLDIFNEVTVRVSASRRTGYLALEEGVLANGVKRLRSDWQRFGLAVNCVRFLQSFGVSPEGAERGHSLMCRTLRLLEEAEELPRPLPFYFRARLAFDQGYALEPERCSSCRGSTLPGPAYLFLHEGRILCTACAAQTPGQRQPLERKVLAALEGVRSLPPEEWTGLPLCAAGARQFSRAVDGFIQYHVGIAWGQGRFVRV